MINIENINIILSISPCSDEEGNEGEALDEEAEERMEKRRAKTKVWHTVGTLNITLWSGGYTVLSVV